MNEIPDKVWEALVELQQACADAAMPLASVAIVGATGMTRYDTTMGSFHVLSASHDDAKRLRAGLAALKGAT